MIALNDSIEDAEDWEIFTGLTNCFRDSQLESCSPEGLVDFVTVASTFYSELERWYCEEAQEWLRERARQQPR